MTKEESANLQRLESLLITAVTGGEEDARSVLMVTDTILRVTAGRPEFDAVRVQLSLLKRFASNLERFHGEMYRRWVGLAAAGDLVEQNTAEESGVVH